MIFLKALFLAMCFANTAWAQYTPPEPIIPPASTTKARLKYDSIAAEYMTRDKSISSPEMITIDDLVTSHTMGLPQPQTVTAEAIKEAMGPIDKSTGLTQAQYTEPTGYTSDTLDTRTIGVNTQGDYELSAPRPERPTEYEQVRLSGVDTKSIPAAYINVQPFKISLPEYGGKTATATSVDRRKMAYDIGTQIVGKPVNPFWGISSKKKNNYSTTQSTMNEYEDIQKIAIARYADKLSQNLKITKQEYISDPNNPKSHGHKIRVTYPYNWTDRPGRKQNNLHFFIDKTQRPFNRFCNINVGNIGYKITPAGYEMMFADKTWQQELNQSINIERYQVTKLDQLPAILLVGNMSLEQMGITTQSKILMAMVGYEDMIITLQCMTVADTQSEADQIFADSKYEFFSFMNSFNLLDQWEIPKPTNIINDLNSDMSAEKNLWGKNWINATIKAFSTCPDIEKINHNDTEAGYALGILIMYNYMTHGLLDWCHPDYTPNNFVNTFKEAASADKLHAESIIFQSISPDALQCILHEFDSVSSDMWNQTHNELTAEIQKYISNIQVPKKDMCILLDSILTTDIELLFKQKRQVYQTIENFQYPTYTLQK